MTGPKDHEPFLVELFLLSYPPKSFNLPETT